MLLVLDTCFSACSAALHDGRVQASRHEVMERGHAEALGPMVEGLFEIARVTPRQLSRIVVTRGPGTFTGLRIGLSYAMGMALALNIPLIGIDSLTAAAVPHFGTQGRFAVALQAGGTGLHYWAAFDGTTSAQITPPGLAPLTDIERLFGSVFSTHPSAKQFAAFAATLQVSHANVEPLYLRPPDAKPSVSHDASSAKVRLAVANDMVAMADIHAASFSRGWSVADFASALSVPGAGALVVELAGTVYGFVQFQWVAGEAEINSVCVSPNYRRQGFGQDLIVGLIAYLRNTTEKLHLEVSTQNVPALRLYGGLGFVGVGQRGAYYADGSDAVLMTLELLA